MPTATAPLPRRSDGSGTRAQLLESAGAIFAVRGFDRATGKEITERAGTNAAAINYHFGSIEGLYTQVLIEAHRSIASLEDIRAILATPDAPETKLRAMIALGIEALTTPSLRWALQVLSREFLSPTPLREIVEAEEMLPKRQLFARLIAEMLGRSEDDPVVSRCCFSVFAPLIVLLVAEPGAAARSFPGCCGDVSPADLTDHLVAFSLAGIHAAAARSA